jgi:hypothetical protein
MILRKRRVELFRRDEFPGLAQVGRQFFVFDARKFYSDPTGAANVRWSIELLRVGFDQGCLDADRCRGSLRRDRRCGD